MTAIDVYSDHGDLPDGARRLGVRVKPIIRLGMGHKDPQRGYPVKDDHFTVRGDDRAVTKFHQVKGDKPRAVEILLPSQLDQALTIQYRAFKGGASEEGGTLVAVGATNYALRDYIGGPDLLTVWNQDGTVTDVETEGVDANTGEPLDEVARELGIQLHTTLRAGMPEVLGFGSFFEVTSKGKETTDNLWAKLRELYSLFGARVSFAVKPQLVIRPSTARPVVKKDGEAKRIKTTIYVLDVVVPETIDEMIDRLATRQAAIAPSGPTAALYGPAALPAATLVETGEAGVSRPSAVGVGADGETQPLPASSVSDDEPEPSLTAPTVEELAAAADRVAATEIPNGQHAHTTLQQVYEQGEPGETWLFYALRHQNTYTPEFAAALEAFVQGRLPELWGRYRAWAAERTAAA